MLENLVLEMITVSSNRGPASTVLLPVAVACRDAVSESGSARYWLESCCRLNACDTENTTAIGEGPLRFGESVLVAEVRPSTRKKTSAGGGSLMSRLFSAD
jgi:hypothetical protein